MIEDPFEVVRRHQAANLDELTRRLDSGFGMYFTTQRIVHDGVTYRRGAPVPESVVRKLPYGSVGFVPLFIR